MSSDEGQLDESDFDATSDAALAAALAIVSQPVTDEVDPSEYEELDYGPCREGTH